MHQGQKRPVEGVFEGREVVEVEVGVGWTVTVERWGGVMVVVLVERVGGLMVTVEVCGGVTVMVEGWRGGAERGVMVEVVVVGRMGGGLAEAVAGKRRVRTALKVSAEIPWDSMMGGCKVSCAGLEG